MKRIISLILSLLIVFGAVAVSFTTVFAKEVNYELVVEKGPDKTQYLIGEKLDLSGISAKLKGDDGSQLDVSENLFIIGFDNASLGTKTVNVYYDVYSTQITVEVVKNVVTDIQITSNPDKTSYVVGEELDTNGLVVIATYTDGTDVDVTSLCEFTGFDKNTAGRQLVIVSYQGFTDSFLVNVYNRELIGLTLKSEPDKLIYNQGEELELSGMSVFAVYSDKTEQDVTKDVTVSGYDPNTSGIQTVTVYYKNMSTAFRVTVNDQNQIQSVSLNTLPDKTFYFSGEALSTDGLSLKIQYVSGKTEVVHDGFTVTGFDTEKLGEQMLTVTYDKFKAYYRVKVLLLGDVNLDSRVTVEDITLLQKYRCCIVDLSDEQLSVSDTDWDGKCTIRDATRIQRYLTGTITSLVEH